MNFSYMTVIPAADFRCADDPATLLTDIIDDIKLRTQSKRAGEVALRARPGRVDEDTIEFRVDSVEPDSVARTLRQLIAQAGRG